MAILRAILALCRLAFLPTIWSNCLAGWWLGGGGHHHLIPVILVAATLAALGASFLNDAFDAEHDQQHHPGRPIPSGVISRKTVWTWAIAWLALATLLFLYVGKTPGILGVLLIFFIICQGGLHRWLPAWPVISGLCRFLLYLLGASVAVRGITGWAIWSGFALGLFTVGVTWFRNWTDKPEKAASWPAALLLAPVIMAFIINSGFYQQAALLLSLILALYVLFALRRANWFLKKDPLAAAHWLLPSIVLADWLAAANAPKELSFLFIGLFLSCLLLQAVDTRLLRPPS